MWRWILRGGSWFEVVYCGLELAATCVYPPSLYIYGLVLMMLDLAW
jgi:hypothetical protein